MRTGMSFKGRNSASRIPMSAQSDSFTLKNGAIRVIDEHDYANLFLGTVILDPK
jgi:hypothetical protein